MKKYDSNMKNFLSLYGLKNELEEKQILLKLKRDELNRIQTFIDDKQAKLSRLQELMRAHPDLVETPPTPVASFTPEPNDTVVNDPADSSTHNSLDEADSNSEGFTYDLIPDITPEELPGRIADKPRSKKYPEPETSKVTTQNKPEKPKEGLIQNLNNRVRNFRRR